MARIRVESTVSGTANSRAISVLSRWAARYNDSRRNLLHNRETASPAHLITQNHARQLLVREKVIEKLIPFSWLRFTMGLGSLVLVFSDIFRGGLGVSSLENHYPALQPDEVLGFGTSWNYSVFAATKAEAYSGAVNATVWAYKADSTSVSWRAFASYFEVSDLPECFLDRDACPYEIFAGDAAFRVIDAVVDAVSQAEDDGHRHFGPVGLMLRTESEYIDRLHQFLLPTWFTNLNWRTNQALYYSPKFLETTCARSICFPANGRHVRTPHFCHELWTNLDRSCAPQDITSRSAGLLYVHTLERLRNVQTRFPNLTVDLTFLESQEDMQVCRGGLSSLGFRRSDVSTIIRARSCENSDTASSCETLFLEDYRYETGLLTSDVVQWYRLVAALRAVGQSYFWLRGFGLMLSCCFIYDTLKPRKKMTIGKRLKKACRLFMKVPTQCVVYGSPFPVICYVLAHLLDAPYAYNVLESHFFSQAGALDIKPESFISYAVVQMRSVWIYALVWQIVASVLASHGLIRSNKILDGVTGVPEFLLSAFSCVTLIAQYRSTTFRSARIVRMMRLPCNIGRAWEAVKYQYSFVHRGRGTALLGGVIIDLKFLICLLFFVAALWAVRSLWMHFWVWKKDEGKHQYSHWFLLPPTPVPYSAGVLWPIVSVCVQWPSAYYCIRDERPRGPLLLQIAQRKHYRHRHPILSRLSWNVDGRFDARVIATNGTVQSKYLPEGELCIRARLTQQRRPMDVYRYIQHKLKCVHRRSDNVEANVAFMNAVLMSDPLVFLSLMFRSGHASELAYYQSIWHPRQVLLLPMAAVCELNEFTGGLKMLRRVNAGDLTWSELVQCG